MGSPRAVTSGWTRRGPTRSPAVRRASPGSCSRVSGGGEERAPRARAGEGARTYRIPWAELLAKVYEIDVLACPECGGRMKLIAFIAEPTVAKRILDHLRPASTGPPLAP